ncbi:MAG: thioredoxin [Candidatus Omnitrophota bacterium]
MGNARSFTDQNFKTDVLGSSIPVLVDFWAEWCGPCRMMAPVIDRLASANEGKIAVGKLNVDENPDAPSQYGIQGIPTLLVFKGGQEVQRIVGFQSQEAIQKVLDDVAR